MIQDDGKLLVAAAPASGLYVGSSFGIDLNPDFGQGVNARRSPLMGMGEDILLRVDVIVAFVAGIGVPVAQFQAVVSNVANATTEVHLGTSIITVGVQAPGQVNIGGAVIFAGFVAAKLTVGTHFFIRLNPWTASMGRNFAGQTVIGKDHRFLGVMVVVPNYSLGPGDHAFSAGAITATLVKAGDVMQDPADFIYPAAVLNVG